MQRNSESGQAIIFVVLAVGICMMGALGLAVDTGQLYGHRQMAQAAADAAAEAAILSIYGASWAPAGTPPAAFICTNGSDPTTPCYYARLNGFGLASSPASETVAVDFPTSIPGGGTLSSDFTPAAVHVLITRPVQTTFLRFLGASATKSVKASAIAAILKVTSPIPIIILHPNMANAFSFSGSGTTKICGGPQQSIQVNSVNPGAVSATAGSEQVDLSKGGPLDTSGLCTTGTGTDFGVFGGIATSTPTTFPSWMSPTGTTTHYYSHNPPIPDPLAGVPAPTTTGLVTNPPIDTTGVNTFPGAGDCPSTVGNPPIAVSRCMIFKPGVYTGGVGVKGSFCGSGGPGDCVAIFHPGTYYVSGTGSGSFSGKGFSIQSNGDAIMCSTTCVADTSGCCSAGGMLVYLTAAGGVFDVTSNASTFLKGSDPNGTYKGILFFEAHDAPAHTGSGSHSLGGGGAMTLQGTIYLTNPKALMLGGQYQSLQMAGGSGSGTLVEGEIIVSQLTLKGGGSVTMNLNSSTTYSINQVALVN